MNNELFDIVNENYKEMFITYCKDKNKYQINNGTNCEDYFNDKVLRFLETNMEEPTVEILKLMVYSKRYKCRKTINTILYKEVDVKEDEITEYTLKSLFYKYKIK